VSSAGELDYRDVPSEQCIDVREVLADGSLIALPLVLLVPLIVIVKNQGDDVVEAVDKTIGCGRIDEAMESAVEVGKVVIPMVDIPQQADVFFA
jgi:hypothetical protein